MKKTSAKTFKKVISAAVALILVLSLTACNLDLFGDDDNGNKDKDKDATEVIICGESYKLTYETSFYDLNYKENLVEFHSDTMGSFRNIGCTNDSGDTLFEVKLVIYKGKTIEQVMEESSYELLQKKVNDLEYTYFAFTEGDLTYHTYVYRFNENAYTISFVSPYDTDSLEKGFMSNVYFKEAE